jgi:hypothetical protein
MITSLRSSSPSFLGTRAAIRDFDSSELPITAPHDPAITRAKKIKPKPKTK